jgi:hypothetical protein
MREPSKPRMRRLPPEVPNGSLLVKFTPGIWLRFWNTLWPDIWVSRYSPEIEMRDLAAVCSPIRPMFRTRVALTTTSAMSSSMASEPVDWANACCARPAPNKLTAAKDHLWNRSNNAPLGLRIWILRLLDAAISVALRVLWSTR